MNMKKIINNTLSTAKQTGLGLLIGTCMLNACSSGPNLKETYSMSENVYVSGIDIPLLGKGGEVGIALLNRDTLAGYDVVARGTSPLNNSYVRFVDTASVEAFNRDILMGDSTKKYLNRLQEDFVKIQKFLYQDAKKAGY